MDVNTRESFHVGCIDPLARKFGRRYPSILMIMQMVCEGLAQKARAKDSQLGSLRQNEC